MSETKTLPTAPPIVNDDEARGRYRAMLEDVGFEPQVAEGVAQDVFSAVAEAARELAPTR